MDDILIVKKMFYQNRSQLWFIEKYYSDLFGFKVKIELSDNSDCSYFFGNMIIISAKDLKIAYRKNKRMFYALFYTLVMHEIGHAIYTGTGFTVTDTLNILEDMRTENLTVKWNTRVRFDLLRYTFQDQMLTLDSLAWSYQNVGLALLRTMDNSKYVKHLCKEQRNKAIVDEVLRLADEYKSKEYRVMEEQVKINELSMIAGRVETLLKKLSYTVPDIKVEESSEQNKDDKPKGDSGLNLKDEADELSNKGELIERDVDNGIGILFNEEPDVTPYEHYNISAFTTYRRAGIKGNGTIQRMTGNAKELSMQRYARRNVVANEKLFDKQSEFGKGGKTASICFYLDISTSMTSHSRITTAINYIKSFYDSMNKHMNIRMFAFGRNTYQIGRDELNYDFIYDHLEGSTSPQAIPLKNNEEVVLVTDGHFDMILPDDFLKKANIVAISANPSARIYFKTYVPKNLYYVENDKIVEGLEEATQGIKRMLRGD